MSFVLATRSFLRVLVACCCAGFLLSCYGLNNRGDLCLASCEGKFCGDDGCGGSCGSCAEPQFCQEGLCVASCQPQCLGKFCGDDGCGGSCGSCAESQRCIEGLCKTKDPNCQPNCVAKSCGDDGCGGTCGSCSSPLICQGGSCATKICQPQCQGKTCGSDACGGTCGSCAEGSTCHTGFGVCQAHRVSGRLLIETRHIHFDRKQAPKFAENVYLPARGIRLQLRDHYGQVHGSTETDDKGDFAFDLPAVPSSDYSISFSALWAPEGELKFGVLVASTNTSLRFEPWAWNILVSDFSSPKDPGHMGEVHIRLSMGSGALYAFMQLKAAMQELVLHGYIQKISQLESLALVWKDGITWSCGACYIKRQPVSAGEQSFKSSMYIGGAHGDESVWGWPTLLHEFGHYVAALTRDDTPGGTHYIGRPSDPRLAWSEGWATFFALMLQSLRADAPNPTYWRLLKSGSYWVDYEQFKASVFLNPPNPKHEQGMRQELAESWVSHLLWDIWDGEDIADPSTQPDPLHYGTARIFAMLHSDRYKNAKGRPRSVPGLDLVDVLDAFSCLYPSFADKLKSFVNAAGFPYDGIPEC